MATTAAAMALDAPLTHIRQRLDALVYDNHSQFLLGSLQHADALTTSARFQQRRAHGASAAALGAGLPHHTTTLGVSIQRRRIPGTGRWARVVGVTPYYVGFALFVGLGWLFQALGVFSFALAFSTIIRSESRGFIAIATPGQSYVALSFFFLAETVGAIGFGACADHYGRRRVLLAAIAMWSLGEALVALAWNYGSLVACRLVAGIGLGGQSALLITIALEFAPKRTRGRILVLSQLLGGVGLIAAALLAKLVTPWRYVFVIPAIASVLFATLYAMRLRESPTYLASTGRLDQALVVLQRMESAHGIDRHARVTVPSSLYAPPAVQQQQQQQQQRRRSSRTSSRVTTDSRTASSPSQQNQRAYALPDHCEHDEDDADCSSTDDVAPLPLPVPPVSSSSHRRGTGERRSSSGPNYVVPSSGNVGRPRASTDRHAAASPAMVSFTVSSTKRFGVLFQSHYLRKTLFLWALWFCVSGAFGTAITCILRRFDKVDRASTGTYVFVGAMALPGLLLSAALVEQLGRKVALAALLFSSAVVLFIVGASMSATASTAGLVMSVGVLSAFVAGAFSVLCVYTGEHYALMVRAMGIAWALACGHAGSFVGVYAVLTHWIMRKGDVGHQIMLWVAGAICFALVFVLLAVGTETQGLDIDVIEPLKTETVKREAPVCSGADDDESHMDEFGLESDRKFSSAHHHARPVHFATEQLSTVPSSPGASFSSASSDSSESSTSRAKTWKKQMRAFAAAAAAAVPLRKSAALRKHSTRSTLHSDSCGDLDQLDAIVTDSEAKAAKYLRQSQHHQSAYFQTSAQPSLHEKLSMSSGILGFDGPQRKRTAASDASEPALLDWRPSNPGSDDDDSDDRHLHGGIDSLHDRSDSETDKFSIEVDAFDRYSSLSTPMLEGSPQLSFER